MYDVGLKNKTAIQNPLSSITVPCKTGNAPENQVSYTPVAFSIHEGNTLNSGHYIYIERDDSGQWWKYNDLIKNAKPEKIDKKTAELDAKDAVNIYLKKF
jgi:uncharacterized UBP type Zn finger protein